MHSLDGPASDPETERPFSSSELRLALKQTTLVVARAIKTIKRAFFLAKRTINFETSLSFQIIIVIIYPNIYLSIYLERSLARSFVHCNLSCLLFDSHSFIHLKFSFVRSFSWNNSECEDWRTGELERSWNNNASLRLDWWWFNSGLEWWWCCL